MKYSTLLVYCETKCAVKNVTYEIMNLNFKQCLKSKLDQTNQTLQDWLYITKVTLSRIEAKKRPYSQEAEAIATLHATNSLVACNLGSSTSCPQLKYQTAQHHLKRLL